jgi:hypothetical protein
MSSRAMPFSPRTSICRCKFLCHLAFLALSSIVGLLLVCHESRKVNKLYILCCHVQHTWKEKHGMVYNFLYPRYLHRLSYQFSNLISELSRRHIWRIYSHNCKLAVKHKNSVDVCWVADLDFFVIPGMMNWLAKAVLNTSLEVVLQHSMLIY